MTRELLFDSRMSALRTNYITNPSFEVNITGWNAFFSPTRVRDTTEFHRGVASYKITNTGGNAQEGTSASGIPVANLIDGDVVTLTAWLKMAVGVTVRMGFRRDSGAGTSPVNTAGTGDWQKVTATLVFNAASWGGTYTQVGPIFTFVTGTTGQIFYIDEVYIAPNDTGVYFDGTFPNAKFTGTAHASTSVGYRYVGII